MRILRFEEIDPSQLLMWDPRTADVSAAVAEIITQVRSGGDEAVLSLGARFDRVRPSALRVPQEELEAAEAALDPALKAAMQRAAKNIRAFHERQKREGFRMDCGDGSYMGQMITPIEKVGLYIPGGTAAYPSTVFMNAIPAAIAGCSEIIMASPPGSDGHVKSQVLAAARMAGVTRVYAMGGAQAVAAMAYGTESVPRVDKIVGPGNAYVAEAKRQVFGRVNIDMIAGPSEILVLADGGADPAFVAADLLSQAEHDRMAAAVLVTDSMELAQAVSSEVERQLVTLPRQEIARESETARSSSPEAFRTPWRRPTAWRRSTWCSMWRARRRCCPACGTPAPCSWDATARNPWGTTWPVPTIPCPPRARRGSPAPWGWMTLSRRPSSPVTVPRPSSRWRRISRCLPGRRGWRPTPARP